MRNVLALLATSLVLAPTSGQRPAWAQDGLPVEAGTRAETPSWKPFDDVAQSWAGTGAGGEAPDAPAVQALEGAAGIEVGGEGLVAGSGAFVSCAPGMRKTGGPDSPASIAIDGVWPSGSSIVVVGRFEVQPRAIWTGTREFRLRVAAGGTVTLKVEDPDTGHVYHQLACQVPSRGTAASTTDAPPYRLGGEDFRCTTSARHGMTALNYTFLSPAEGTKILVVEEVVARGRSQFTTAHMTIPLRSDGRDGYHGFHDGPREPERWFHVKITQPPAAWWSPLLPILADRRIAAVFDYKTESTSDPMSGSCVVDRR